MVKVIKNWINEVTRLLSFDRTPPPLMFSRITESFDVMAPPPTNTGIKIR